MYSYSQKETTLNAKKKVGVIFQTSDIYDNHPGR
jgi:hypothetical protein